MGFGINGAFMPAPPTATWDGDGAVDGTVSHKKDKNLKDMFAPPTDLMYVGPFQAARQAAKESKRWLMINIQRDSDFASHALNRDVWSSETVESVVKTGFVFWQMMEEREEGRIYCERYKVESFPHIAFLDPRTGRSMWSKEGWSMENPVTAETFLESVVDFLDRNSFDRPPSAPKVDKEGSMKKPRIEDASETDQMEAAIRASLNEDMDTVLPPPVKSDGGGDDEVQVVDPPAAPAAPPKPPSMAESLQAFDVPPEPAEGGVKVAFRLPTGRLVRKFPSDAIIGQVFAFVAGEVKMAEEGGKEFELRAGYPVKVLKWEGGETVEQLKLQGEQVTFRWIEE